jgi:hypothetical protein
MKKLTLLILVLFVLVLFAIAIQPFPSSDWVERLYPAGVDFIHGLNPYRSGWLMNPPQVLLIIGPLALLGEQASHGVLAALTLVGLAFVCMKYKASPLTFLLFFGSCFTTYTIYNGNLEGILLPALFIPPTWGMPIMVIKPQIGAGYIIYHLWDSRKNQKFIRIIFPLFFITILGIILYPGFLLNSYAVTSQRWNLSFFPYGLPLAAIMLVVAAIRKQPELALAASPFMTPYLNITSYIVIPMMVMATTSGKLREVLMLILFIASWWFRFG